jgi:hypothetical protein
MARRFAHREKRTGVEMLKLSLSRSEELLRRVNDVLGPDRVPLLIALDGADGVGKSSLASWLAWQTGMPTVHLDLYLIRDSYPLKWRTEEVSKLIHARLDRAMPVIIEGVFVLDVLDQIGRRPDFLIFVRGEGGRGLSKLLNDYNLRRKVTTSAQFVLDGFAGLVARGHPN